MKEEISIKDVELTEFADSGSCHCSAVVLELE